MAGAVRTPSWRSCCTRGRRWPAAGCRVAGAVHTEPPAKAAPRVVRAWARGWPQHWLSWAGSCTNLLRAWSPLARAGHSTQSLLQELLRAWQARWPASGCRVAGAVHRASWRSCCARGRRGPAAGHSTGWRSTQSLLEGAHDSRPRASGDQARSSSSRKPCHVALRLLHDSQPRGQLATTRATAPPGSPVTASHGPAPVRLCVLQPATRQPACGPAGDARGQRLCVLRAVGPAPPGGPRTQQAGAVHRASWQRSCCGRSRKTLARGWLSCGLQSFLEELLCAWSPLARGWLSCGRRSTQSLLEEVPLARAGWSRGRRSNAGRGWLSCGRRSTQSLLEELVRAWPPLARVLCVNVVRGSRDRRRCEEHSNCHLILHHIRHKSHIRYAHISHTHLSHTIFHTPLCHTPSFTQLFHTPSFTHNFVKHNLSHTIYDTTSLTHTIFHTPSQTIFHTPLCHTPSFTQLFHTPSFTHNFVTHHLSPHHLCHTPSFTTPSFTHTHTTLSHTIFLPPPPLSFLPSPSPLQHFLLITGRS